MCPAMFTLLRVFRRRTGSFSIADLPVIVIIADAASQMRENGIEDVKKVRIAYLESDGNFSFIKKENNEESKSG